jgi:hypothetical protein
MTNDERKKLYQQLAAPFPDHAIQRTEGRLTGRGYDTTGIGYQFICNRLNEVLGIGGWRAHRTVAVKPITRANGRPAFEAVCDIVLALGEWVNGEFVVFAEALADGGHVAASEADARKGAFTNSFKKAAAFFGVGRQAFEGSLDDDSVPADQLCDRAASTTPAAQRLSPTTPRASAPQSPRPDSQPSRTTTSSTRNRLTSKQLGAIQVLSRKLGYDGQGLRDLAMQQFGAQPEFLSRDQASTLISTLSVQAGNGHAEHRDPGVEG